MNIIIYEKDTGTIKQVMSFRGNIIDISSDSSSIITALQLDRIFNLQEIDVLIYDGPVNIRKDKVLNGIYCTGGANKESDDIFEEVNPTKEITNHSHVAFVSTWRKQCGIAKYTEDLVNECKHKVTVFCEKDTDISNPPENVEVIPCWTNEDKSYTYLVRKIIEYGVDVVHVQYNHDLLNAGELKKFGDNLRKQGIYTVITLHSTKGGVGAYAKHFDHVIAHSELSKQDLINEDVNKDQISVIRIGSNAPLKDAPKEIMCNKKEIDASRPILAIFGFMFPQKGLIELLKAIVILKNDFPDILLLVVSSTKNIQNSELAENYFKQCVDFVDIASLHDNVTFITDYLPFREIFNYLHCADLLVMPYVHSASQATSSAGRTALASLRPALATEVEIFDDLKEIIPQIPPKDVKAIVDNIAMLLSDEKQRKAIVKRSKYFLEETSWKNIAKEHSYIYKPFSDIKIHIEGQVFSYFSASVVNRRLACGLDEIGVDISLSSVNLAENEEYDLGDDSRKLVGKKRHTNICVRHFFPPKFSDIESDVKIIYLPVETTTAPNDWLVGIEKYVDYVWVYSNHGKNVLIDAGITKPVEVIKCGYDPVHFNLEIEPIDLSQIKDSFTKKTVDVNSDTFVFTFCGHAQERKNFRVILEAYLREFSLDENILFVLKSYDGGEVHKMMKEIIADVEMDSIALPKYLYVYEDTPPEKLSRYYAATSCMVQCSRAEGFGLPIVEAMAMGIPSIVNLFGGPEDFCTEDNSFPVPFRFVESDYHVQSKNDKSLWANNKVIDVQNVMRHVFEHPDELKEKGQQAIRDAKSWTYRDGAYDVIKFIRKYNLN